MGVAGRRGGKTAGRPGEGKRGRYRVGGDGILDVEVEAKVDHVENSVAPQSGSQSFIQAPQSQSVHFDDSSGLGEGRRLLDAQRTGNETNGEEEEGKGKVRRP